MPDAWEEKEGGWRGNRGARARDVRREWNGPAAGAFVTRRWKMCLDRCCEEQRGCGREAAGKKCGWDPMSEWARQAEREMPGTFARMCTVHWLLGGSTDWLLSESEMDHWWVPKAASRTWLDTFDVDEEPLACTAITSLRCLDDKV
jgi:hypothetical protein